MGTYLSLKLKNRSNRNVHLVNKVWKKENPGFENTLHFNTVEDIQKDVDWIQKNQEHLRYIKTVKDYNNTFGQWGVGTFQVKLTLGDYLCSEMARRYINFLSRHGSLFVKYPDEYVMGILIDTAATNEKASECLVNCPYCQPVLEKD